MTTSNERYGAVFLNEFDDDGNKGKRYFFLTIYFGVISGILNVVLSLSSPHALFR